MNHHVVLEINETIRLESYSKLDHSIDIPLNELDKAFRVFDFLKRFLKEANKIND